MGLRFTAAASGLYSKRAVELEPPMVEDGAVQCRLGADTSLRLFDPPRCGFVAIQRVEPNTPCNSAGTHTSAPSFGQCSPSPAGLISTRARSLDDAAGRPSARFGENVIWTPVLRLTRIRAARRS